MLLSLVIAAAVAVWQLEGASGVRGLGDWEAGRLDLVGKRSRISARNPGAVVAAAAVAVVVATALAVATGTATGTAVTVSLVPFTPTPTPTPTRIATATATPTHPVGA